MAERRDTIDAYYVPLSVRAIHQHAPVSSYAPLIASWLFTIALSITLGLASIIYEWSGVPMVFGGLELNITFYPPLIFCVFWVLWFGFWWGFIPAYLSTLVLALYSGMPLGWSLIFAFADPLGLAVLAVAYRALPISFNLRSVDSILTFVGLSFISGVMGSTGSFIWTHTNDVAAYDLFPIWQGWWLGAFLQNLIFVAPVLYLATPTVMRLRDPLVAKPLEHKHTHREAAATCFTILLGILIYQMASLTLGEAQLTQSFSQDNPAVIRAAAQSYLSSTSAIFWINSIILLFFTFFGYKFVSHWVDNVRTSELKWRNAYSALTESSKLDDLSGLYNRGTWEKLIDQEHQRALSEGAESTLMLLDIDYFKRINDSLGHLSGDKAIRLVSEVLLTCKRDTDIAGRYGGEEFIIVMPNTSIQGAYTLAERIHRHLEDIDITNDNKEINITASIGLASIEHSGKDYYSWIAHADRALYEAKLRGRNCTIVYSETMLKQQASA